MNPLALIFILIVILLTPSISYSVPEVKTDRFTLSNGMQVLVIENHKIPAIAHMVWYKIGAADEVPGKTGLAHYLEHLMFKSTENLKEGEFNRLIAYFGGKNNAFTAYDKTVYFETIAKEHIELVMLLEAERMTKLTFNEETVEREKKVILEERSMRVDNNPRSSLSEQMRAALYLNHPYGRPVIGWRHEIEGLALEDCRKFYEKYYAPNNAILVVAGDITAEELRPLAEKYYGKIKSSDQEITARLPFAVSEPVHNAIHEITVKDPKVIDPEWMRFYLSPSAVYGKKEYAPLIAVLAQILGGSDTGRLYKSLVTEKGLATAVYTAYDEVTIGPAEFRIHVQPKNGVSLDKIRKAVDEEIKKILDKGVTDEELRRAKNTIISDTIFSRDGLQNMAFIYGMVISIGMDKEYVDKWPDVINSVTKEQVSEAAHYVLKEESSVTGKLLPGK